MKTAFVIHQKKEGIMGGWRLLRYFLIAGLIFLASLTVSFFPVIGSAGGAEIEELERRVQELEQKVHKEKKPSIISRTRLGGYVEFEYEDTEGKKSTFDNHRLILLVNSRITENIRFYTELEYEHGTKEIELEQAYINFGLHDLLSISAGAFLVPVGRLNIYHDAPLLETTSRPMVDTFIIPTTWTDVGVGVSGQGTIGRKYFLGYEAYVMNGLEHEDSSNGINGSRGLRNARQIEDGASDFEQDINSNKSLTGRAYVRYGTLVEVGVSGFTGKVDEANDAGVNLYAFDWLLKYHIFELVGEYAKANISTGGLSIPSGMDGFYIEGRTHLLPPVMKVPSWAKKFTAVYRYGEVDLDEDVTDENDKSRHTIGLNYRPITTVAVKGEYQFNGEKENKTENDTILLSVTYYF
jgi:hypothetical protein